MNTLEVEIETKKEKIGPCIKAIEPELSFEAQRRSDIKLSRKDDSLLLRIEAEDLTALRAALNTYLRWIDMCLDLTE